MVRINLLPIRSLLRKRELKQFYVIAGVIVAVAFVVMALVYAYFDSEISKLEALKATKTKELADLKQKNQEIADLKAKVESLQQQVKSVRDLTKRRISPAPFMQAVSLAIPSDVWLERVQKTDTGFQVTGSGVDNTVVVDFVQRLQKLKKKQVDPTATKDEQERLFFSKVELKRVTRASGRGGLDEIKFEISGVVN
ncbi:MAG: PilN domain-containing protein [Thermodesulfobacteriota bacterium]